MSNDFADRTEKNLNDEVLSKCSALDPRFKSLKCLERYKRERVWDNIAEELIDVKQKKDAKMQRNNAREAPNPLRNKQLGTFFLESSESESDSDNENADEIKIELANYRKEPSIAKTEDPLQYWKSKESVFPLLAKLAKKYLCVQATSTTAERIFSKLGLPLTKRRLCLDEDRSDRIMFLSDKV